MPAPLPGDAQPALATVDRWGGSWLRWFVWGWWSARASVRAALALCAQRSPRTQKWYQAEAVARRRMLGGQEMIAGLVEVSDEDADLLASLAECDGLPAAGGSDAAPAAR